MNVIPVWPVRVCVATRLYICYLLLLFIIQYLLFYCKYNWKFLVFEVIYFTLEVQLGSQYTLSVELLLDRKLKEIFRHLTDDPTLSWRHVLKIRDTLRTSCGRPAWTSGTSLERQIRASPGCHFWKFSVRQIETFPGWSNRMFRGRTGDQYLPSGQSQKSSIWLTIASNEEIFGLDSH